MCIKTIYHRGIPFEEAKADILRRAETQAELAVFKDSSPNLRAGLSVDWEKPYRQAGLRAESRRGEKV